MSYIGLLNEESSSSNSSFVASTDYLTVGRAFTNYGVMTQLDNSTFSGATGITTTALIFSGAVSGSQIQYQERHFQRIIFQRVAVILINIIHQH